MFKNKAIARKIARGFTLGLIPLVLLIFIGEKAIGIIKSLIQPLMGQFGIERIFGVGILGFASLGILLLICFLFGLVTEMSYFKSRLEHFSERVGQFIPGFRLLKIWIEESTEDLGSGSQSVLVSEGDQQKLGILVEKTHEAYALVFFPEPPDGRSGELKLVPVNSIIILEMSIIKMAACIRRYGKGLKDLKQVQDALHEKTNFKS